ncbi:Bug family tripartite tricarboxylate transporter substrate binding protein [Pigmentiphaga kullae]|uniref:Tripartite-type tricarboxylate transporter receptor subunit TctC n=1 Tax=Pigmentiphaga kullae TaxID=151784 RepID=A0A4V2F478_9BURK|nr:tripartite tricarboxylate transporter substrate binding protein [Pigmentiphaga kullae]RZS86657.1 tripartite-type tricarboxylate transporter receptor subunit TctC [Pigmentiphaga kullae]
MEKNHGGFHGIKPFFCGALALALPICAAAAAQGPAANYPERAVKLIVPFPPGGPNDTSSRVFASHLANVLKRSVYVENVAGANGRIGSKTAAKASPDGYSLLVGSTNLNVVLPALNKNLDYDPVKDFIPIAAFSSDSLIMAVSPGLPVNSVQEFVSYAKAKPGKISAGGASGIAPHFAIEMFKQLTATDILFVPYKGGGPAILDLIGGHIQMTFNNKSALLPYIQSGKVKAIAVTGTRRQAEIPNVPTMDEVGLAGMPSTSYYGLMAPAGTPPEIVEKLKRAVATVSKSAEARAAFANLGVDPDVSDIDFGAVLARQRVEWESIVARTGIKAE